VAAAGVVVDFDLPGALEAREPPEARGLQRDDVRLLVTDVARDGVEHARFRDLPRWVSAGDVLVVNTSGTLNAALPIVDDTRQLQLHLSSRLPGGFWTVEIRQRHGGASGPFREVRAGERFALPDQGAATVLAPYPFVDQPAAGARLWMATVRVPGPMAAYLERFGMPIRYRYVTDRWPSRMYQTVFATEPGSAEMPSAGRPFTSGLVTTLVSRGVQVAPLLLHTGVSSLEDHEPPYEEYFRVSRDTAERVTSARRAGHRIIAVGTTVVRALETVTDGSGVTSPGEGWTSMVIARGRSIRAIDGLITGLHEPRASHLTLLEQAIAAARRRVGHVEGLPPQVEDREILAHAYAEALGHGYLWHEFGDSHLIIAS
jgi:S-adenosylmethionine:tRNA ribosyltransferase-isomerase